MPTPRHGPACRTSPSLPPSASQEQPPAGPIVPSEEGWRRDGSPPEWGVLSPRRVPRGRSPSSLGRRARGAVPSTLPPGPGWGAGQAPLLESVFIRIYLEQLPTWLSRGAAQLLEKHQGLGISSRNHLVPTDLTLHPLPVPGTGRAGAALAPRPVPAGGFDIQTLSRCSPSSAGASPGAQHPWGGEGAGAAPPLLPLSLRFFEGAAAALPPARGTGAAAAPERGGGPGPGPCPPLPAAEDPLPLPAAPAALFCTQ